MKKEFDIIRRFKWNSLFFKYLKILIITVIIPAVLINSIMYIYYTNSAKTETNYTLKKNMDTKSDAFDEILSTVDRFYFELMKRTSVLQFMSKDILEAPPAISYAVFDDIHDLFNKFKVENTYISSLCLYSSISDYTISTNESNYSDKLCDNSWLLYSKEIHSGNYIASLKSSPGLKNPDVISICYEYTKGYSPYGLVVINISIEDLNRVLASATESKVFILDSNNEVIYPFVEAAERHLPLSEFSFETNKSNVLYYDSKIYSYRMLLNRNLKIVEEFRNDVINSGSGIILTNMITIIIITLISILILSFAVSMNLYQSIANSIIYIENDGRNIKEKENELTYIVHNILSTTKNYNNIENELLEKMQLLKKAQSVALQTQINPHFLFNTLNLVNGYILEISCGDDKATAIIAKLSELLCYSLDTQNIIVTLESELEHTKKYVEIEEIKYCGDVSIEWIIDENTLNKKVLKLILQPIIENAIEHGTSKLIGKKGKIVISASEASGVLYINVFDNGYRIPEQKLNELNASFSSDSSINSSHIGLSNVNQRIKITFGTQYGCSISSSDSGTNVTICLPV